MSDVEVLAGLDFDYSIEWELVTDDDAHIAFGRRRPDGTLFWKCDRTGKATRILHEGHEFARFDPVWLAVGNTLTTTLVE